MTDVPDGVKVMMMDFFAIEPDRTQLVPVTGLNAMPSSYYLNHASLGKGANMKPKMCNCPIMCFYSTREIKKGEELLFDYEDAFGSVRKKETRKPMHTWPFLYCVVDFEQSRCARVFVRGHCSKADSTRLWTHRKRRRPCLFSAAFELDS